MSELQSTPQYHFAASIRRRDLLQTALEHHEINQLQVVIYLQPL